MPGAPFCVLGPLVNDVAPGYDHITGAICGAIAASKGSISDDKKTCTMCGSMCAVRNINKVLNGEEVTLFKAK